MTRPTAARPQRFTAILERSDNKLWGAHLLVPGPVVVKLSGKDDRRVACRLNGSEEYQCAMLPQGNGTFVITVNKSRRERLGISFGAGVRVELRRDESTYGLPMPEEFSELLRQEKKGNTLFHALTKGRQRVLLYIIGSAKNQDQRIVRSITIVRHLIAHNGTINHRLLSHELDATRRALTQNKKKGSFP